MDEFMIFSATDVSSGWHQWELLCSGIGMTSAVLMGYKSIELHKLINKNEVSSHRLPGIYCRVTFPKGRLAKISNKRKIELFCPNFMQLKSEQTRGKYSAIVILLAGNHFYIFI